MVWGKVEVSEMSRLIIESQEDSRIIKSLHVYVCISMHVCMLSGV